MAPLASLRQVTAADLAPGTVLYGKLSGKLRLVYTLEGDATTAKLKFLLSTRLPLDSAYAEERSTPFSIVITLSAPRSSVSVTNNRTRLLKAQQHNVFHLDATGLRVATRHDRGGKLEVELDGGADVRVLLDEREFVLFESRTPQGRVAPKWDFFADGPEEPEPEAAESEEEREDGGQGSRAPSRNDISQQQPQQLQQAQAPASTSFPPLQRKPSFNKLGRTFLPISALPQLNFTAHAAPAPQRRQSNLPAAQASSSRAAAAQARIDLATTQTAAHPHTGRQRQYLPSPSDGSVTDPIVISSSAEAVEEWSPSPLHPRSRPSTPLARQVLSAGPGSAEYPVVVTVSRKESPEAQVIDQAPEPPVASIPAPLEAIPEPTPPHSPPHSKDAEGDSTMAESPLLALQRQVEELQALNRMHAEERARADAERDAELARLRAATSTPAPSSVKTKRSRPETPDEPRKRVRAERAELQEKDPNSQAREEKRDGKKSSDKHKEVTESKDKSREKMDKSRAELQKAAEAKARAAAEAKAREDAARRQAQQQAALIEADAMADRMRTPFKAGGHLYTPLSNLSNQSRVNIMGIVVDPNMPRGGPPRDFSQSIVLTDPSRRADSSGEDTVVTIFRRNQVELQGFEPGAAVLFRGAKASLFNEKPKAQLFSRDHNEFAILSNSGAVVRGASDGGEVLVSKDEYARLNNLKAWFDAKKSDITVVDREHGEGQVTKKERQLGEAHDQLFFDVAVKVISVYSNDRGGWYPNTELYVTDGTVNGRATRNFHNVSAGIPESAVLCLAIFKPMPFTVESGDFLFFRNVRCKLDNAGALELKWSELVTDDLKKAGWRDKVVRKLDKEDPKAKAIDARIAELRAAFKAGQVVEPVVISPPEILKAAAAPTPPVPKLATTVFTKHTDPVNNPITPLAAAIADPTVPNKYRIHARVTRLEPVPRKNASDLAIAFCRRCNSEFEREHCYSCNDTAYAHAEARWRMLVFLEIDPAEKRAALDAFAAARDQEPQETDHPAEIALLLADEHASFLPALPALHSGPNEVKRARAAFKPLRAKVEDMLLGNRFDGQRSRPLIDWSVMKYKVSVADTGGKRASPAPVDVVVWKVFGMGSKS